MWALVCMGGLLALAACHDAHRDNPFDPALTPAVERVTVDLDEATGTAVVEWLSYEGQQPFAAYWVLRKPKGLEAVDTLQVIEDVHRTVFRDTTLAPDREYAYWITVVNAGGFTVESTPVTVRSFSIPASELLEVRADSLQGRVSLRWEQYRGPRFERYEVHRRRFGEEHREVLVPLAEPSDTLWIDATPLPHTDYLYRVVTFASGQERSSAEREVRYGLPSVELIHVEFSSFTATAELAWTPYRGPRFEAYEIHRQAGEGVERIVAERGDMDRTTYTDTLLNGNTTYTYWISVRTTWGIEVSSPTREGKFYALADVRRVSGLDTATKPHAVGLALDEEDGLYVVMTTISTTTARAMQQEIKLFMPGRTSFRIYYLLGVRPGRLATAQGKVYVSVTSDDSMMVGALDREGREL